MAATTSWIPPPYEPPIIPTRGSPLRSSRASGLDASQSSST